MGDKDKLLGDNAEAEDGIIVVVVAVPEDVSMP